MAPPRVPLIERLTGRTQFSGECWLWTGTTSGGYGQMKIDGRPHLVHRVAYELLVGPIPAGLVIDHLCRVRRCWNPDHLEPKTQRENLLAPGSMAAAAAKAAQTHCVNGHSLEDAYVYGTVRHCRPCTADRDRVKRKAS